MEKRKVEGLKGEVIGKGESKKQPTKYGKKDFCEAEIEDEEGQTHKVALWGSQVTKIDKGDSIEIQEGVYDPEYSNISVFKGNLKVVDSTGLHHLGEIDQLFLNEQGEPKKGFNKGDWVLLYGEAGTGKSVIARQAAKFQAKNGERVIYASTEETLPAFESHSGLEEEVVKKMDFENVLNRPKLYDNKKSFLDFLGESFKNSELTVIDALSSIFFGHDSLEQLLIKMKREKSNHPGTSFITTSYPGSSGGTAASKFFENAVDISIKLERKYPNYDQAGVKKGNMLRPLALQKSRFTKIDPRKHRFKIENGSEIELLKPISEYE